MMEGLSLSRLLEEATLHVEGMHDEDLKLALECGIAAGSCIREGWAQSVDVRFRRSFDGPLC